MEALRSADGKPGLDVVYYEDMEFQKEVYHEVAKVVNLSAIEGLHQVLLCICLMVMVLNGVVKYFLLSVVNIRLFLSNDRSMIEVFVNGKKIYEITRKKEHLGDGKVYWKEASLPIL